MPCHLSLSTVVDADPHCMAVASHSPASPELLQRSWHDLAATLMPPQRCFDTIVDNVPWLGAAALSGAWGVLQGWGGGETGQLYPEPLGGGLGFCALLRCAAVHRLPFPPFCTVRPWLKCLASILRVSTSHSRAEQ